MSEKITGEIFLENNAGESKRLVDAPIGETTYVEGTYGTLVIDAYVKNPPLIQGKGDVYLLDDKRSVVRTLRLKKEGTITVVISINKIDYKEIGQIRY